jgi:protein TonB
MSEHVAPPLPFGAGVCAGRARTPGEGRRQVGVGFSVLAHAAALVLLALASGAKTAAPSPTPAPILVHLSLPRARLPAAAAAKTPPAPNPPRRPRPPLSQPAPALLPPAVIPPDEPTPAVAEHDVAEDTADQADEPEVGGDPGAVAAGVVRASGNDPLELGEVARRPTVIEQATPNYPADARWRRLEGVVLVRVVIDTTGAVEEASVKVMRSVPGLDEAAMAAIKRWRFTPAIDHSGRPVRVIVEVPFAFSLH